MESWKIFINEDKFVEIYEKSIRSRKVSRREMVSYVGHRDGWKRRPGKTLEAEQTASWSPFNLGLGRTSWRHKVETTTSARWLTLSKVHALTPSLTFDPWHLTFWPQTKWATDQDLPCIIHLPSLVMIFPLQWFAYFPCACITFNWFLIDLL